jgi:NAD(P)-dependent dehydrogenase (short-subunit alcohol dehydrogenase family)
MTNMATQPVIIVTGAAGGIGYEITKQLVEEHGACVVATDIVAGKLQDLASTHKGKLEVIIGDVVDVSKPHAQW